MSPDKTEPTIISYWGTVPLELSSSSPLTLLKSLLCPKCLSKQRLGSFIRIAPNDISTEGSSLIRFVKAPENSTGIRASRGNLATAANWDMRVDLIKTAGFPEEITTLTITPDIVLLCRAKKEQCSLSKFCSGQRGCRYCRAIEWGLK